MSALARYIVDAIVLDGQRPDRAGTEAPISGSRIYQLLARFKSAGYPAWMKVDLALWSVLAMATAPAARP